MSHKPCAGVPAQTLGVDHELSRETGGVATNRCE